MISYVITLYESQLEIGQFVVCSRNILKWKRLLFHCHNSFLFCIPRYNVYILHQTSQSKYNDINAFKFSLILRMKKFINWDIICFSFHDFLYSRESMCVYINLCLQEIQQFQKLFFYVSFSKPFFAHNHDCKGVTRKVMEKLESSSYIKLTAYNAHCQKM